MTDVAKMRSHIIVEEHHHALRSVIPAALREHFSTKYVVGDEIYSEIDAFEKEQRNDT